MMITRVFKVLASCSMLFALYACASAPTGNYVEPDAGEAVDADISEYVIGPGDSLQIFVWQHPDVSTVVPVRPDGKISMPLVEDMLAEGKTPTELSRDLEQELGRYIKNPVVNVIVTSFIGQFSRQIRVVGQAANPMALPYREGISLLDIMIEVGGLTEFAAGNKAKIIRKQGGSEQEIPVRLRDLLDRGDISQNRKMYPGDVLIIPESFF